MCGMAACRAEQTNARQLRILQSLTVSRLANLALDQACATSSCVPRAHLNGSGHCCR